MKQRAWMMALAALLASSALSARADDLPGKKVAMQCQACHGIDGVSRMPEAPNLAGQVDVYLDKALHDFKSGARKNEMMSVIAGGLSDQQMHDVAQYYAALSACAKP